MAAELWKFLFRLFAIFRRQHFENGLDEAIQPHIFTDNIPDSKVHGANMRPIWGRQHPGGPHVGPMNFVIWDTNLLWKCVQQFKFVFCHVSNIICFKIVNNVIRTVFVATISGLVWQPLCIVSALLKSKLIVTTLLSFIILKTKYLQDDTVDLCQIESG